MIPRELFTKRIHPASQSADCGRGTVFARASFPTRARFFAGQKLASKLPEKLEEQAYLRYGREKVSSVNEWLVLDSQESELR